MCYKQGISHFKAILACTWDMLDTRDDGRGEWEYQKPRWFVNSQWPCIPQSLYLVWRLLAFMFGLALFILQCIVGNSNRYLFLTHWSFYTLFANTICHLGIVTHSYHQSRSTGSRTPDVMPWYYKMTWLLYSTGTNSGLLVTALFWTVLYTPNMHLSVMSISLHALNTVYILLDLCITGMPVRIQHFVFGLAFGVIYSVFNVIYVNTDGVDLHRHHYIYKVISWENKRTSTQWTVIALVLSVLLWIVVYTLVRLRVFIYKRCCEKRYALLEPTREGVSRSGDSGGKSGEYQYVRLEDLETCNDII